MPNLIPITLVPIWRPVLSIWPPIFYYNYFYQRPYWIFITRHHVEVMRHLLSARRLSHERVQFARSSVRRQARERVKRVGRVRAQEEMWDVEERGKHAGSEYVR